MWGPVSYTHLDVYKRQVLNNALSGVDEALWDIKGKLAKMPLYCLFGGKCREGIAVYRHADGSSIEEVEERIREFMEEGFRYIRCHMGTYGGNFDGTIQKIARPEGCLLYTSFRCGQQNK